MFVRLLRKNYQPFSSQYLKKVRKLFQEGKYQQIFEVSPQNVTKAQLKERYNNLLKKYHSDYNQNDKQNADTFQEISKIVIQSYRKINSKYSNTSNESSKEETQIEDQISMRLFNKKYSEIKYWIYEKGNQQQKKSFLTQLYLKTGREYKEKKDETIIKKDENERKNSFYAKESAQTSQESDIPTNLAVAGVISLVGLFIYSSFRDYGTIQKTHGSKDNITSGQQRNKYSQENITKIKNKKEKERKQKAEIMINSILKDHPLSLKFPDEEPHIMKQLTQFSIAPDIHLYQVSPECYRGTKKINIIQNGFDKIKENNYELSKIKPNTTMTLSLEAERALQNIYVKVTDVINQIKKNGKFIPPQVFLRFHGYIMCQIREKPLTLTNYKDTDYISLFDLFFDYYSPIFLKRDQYSQYLVCKDEIEYFGWVHLNNKKCQPVYLKSGQKAAYFHSQREQTNEQLYRKIWNGYYKYYYFELNEKNNNNVSNKAQ